MKKQKERELLLIDKMKTKLAIFLVCVFLSSCTSNTIFDAPKDLIPRDTMSLLLQEMMLATSAKFINNKNKEKNINYMPFVYNKYKIDSTRFENSNFYYMSKIDLYKEILESAKKDIEKKEAVLKEKQSLLDSIRKDSLKLAKIEIKREDSLRIVLQIEKDSILKDSIKRLKLK